MISEINREEIPLNLNPEIHEMVEKIWSKSSQTTKEKHDKSVIEILQFFLQQLNKNLSEGNQPEITDLIYDKSTYVTEVIGNSDWPNAEVLKVPNLERLSLPFYLYIKSRLGLLLKSKKQSKEAPVKAAENIINILNYIIENISIIHLQNSLIYFLFKDLFTFYVMSNYNQSVKENILNTIDFYKEETNISGLAKMENIDKSVEMNFFLGTLSVLLEFKLSLAENGELKINSDFESILKHEEVLRGLCFLADAELLWVVSTTKFILGTFDENTLIQVKTSIEKGRILSFFIKSCSPKFTEQISYGINLLRTLMVISLVDCGIKLNENLLNSIMYEPYETEMILSASLGNLSPIKKIFKMNANVLYQELNFSEKILQKMQSDTKDEDKAKKFREILFTWELDKDTPKKDFSDDDYLKFPLVGYNSKFNSLIQELK